jgi:hypothetical protein
VALGVPTVGIVEWAAVQSTPPVAERPLPIYPPRVYNDGSPIGDDPAATTESLLGADVWVGRGDADREEET